MSRKKTRSQRSTTLAVNIPRAAVSTQSNAEVPLAAKTPTQSPQSNLSRFSQLFWGLVFAAAFVWAYWPTLLGLVDRWSAVADYSHGFLVVPLAVGFLVFRRDLRPTVWQSAPIAGLLVVALATGIRYLSGRMFLPSLDGWSIPLWLAGACLWLGGTALLRWCWPSLLFLVFMVPLPYRAEYALSAPLRQAATTASCWVLQCLRQPAVQDGTTIILNDQELDIAEECSGLRMLVSIVALTTAYLILVRKPWWQKILLCVLAVPVALLANVTRIVATAFATQYASTEAGRTLAHDSAGWVTTGAAFVYFMLVLWCFRHMFLEFQTMDGAALIRSRPTGN